VDGAQWDDANVGDYSVATGFSTTASGSYSTAMGGASSASGFTSTALGSASASGTWAAAIGQGANASGDHGSIALGYVTTASGESSTAIGANSTASGGWSVAMGYNAIASGVQSVSVGTGTAAFGYRSFAAGFQGVANHDGAFVWADHTQSGFSSSAGNEFAARATGGVRFVTAVDGFGAPTAGVSLAPGAGSWSSLSDRSAKADFAPVDPCGVLERVAALPIQTWRYRSQSGSVRHIGPVAQDFYQAFGVGEDERHISTVDAQGVALAAVQGLHQELREAQARIEILEGRIADLLSRLEARR
jgi:hypothetical protein